MATTTLTGTIDPNSINLGEFTARQQVVGTLKVAGQIFDRLFIGNDRLFIGTDALTVPSTRNSTNLTYTVDNADGTSLSLPASIVVNGGTSPYTLTAHILGPPTINANYKIFSSDADNFIAELAVRGIRDAVIPIAFPKDILVTGRPIQIVFQWLGDFSSSLDGHTYITALKSCPRILIGCSLTAIRKSTIPYFFKGRNTALDIPNPFKNFRKSGSNGRLQVYSASDIRLNRRHPTRQESVPAQFLIASGFDAPKDVILPPMKPGAHPKDSPQVTVEGDLLLQSYGYATRLITNDRKTLRYNIKDTLRTEKAVNEFILWLYTVKGRSGIFNCCAESPLSEIFDITRIPGGYKFVLSDHADVLENEQSICFSAGYYKRVYVPQVYNKTRIANGIEYTTNTDISDVYRDRMGFNVYKSEKYRLASNAVTIQYYNPRHIECSLELVRLQYQ